jgi:hypothetical protein
VTTEDLLSKIPRYCSLKRSDLLAVLNELSIDDIKAGTSMPRNRFLFNNAIYLLPYTGVGSGITRALGEDVNVTFSNNEKVQEFVITLWREKVTKLSLKVTKSEGKVTKSERKVTKSKTMILNLETLALKESL